MRRRTLSVVVALLFFGITLAGCFQAPRPVGPDIPVDPDSPSIGVGSGLGFAQRPGGFQLRDGVYHGAYVSIHFQAAQGNIRVFSVGGAEFFDSIKIACPCEASVVPDDYERASKLRIEGTSTTMVFLDHPTGHLTYEVRSGGDVRFTLSDAVEADARAGGLLLSRGDHQAWVRAQAEGTSAAPTVEQSGATRTVKASASGMFFLRDPAALETLFGQNGAKLEKAVLDGKLAAQVQVLPTVTTNEPQILSYAQVDVKAQELPGLTYEVVAEGQLESGSSFVLHLPIQATGKLDRIEVSHQTGASVGALAAVEITRATSLDDVLDPQPDEGPEYYVVESFEGYQVLFSVPHWSIQLFQVVGIPPESAPIFAYGVVMAFLLLGVVMMGSVFGKTKKAEWAPIRRRLLPWLPIGPIMAAPLNARGASDRY